jgi:transcriptional regulator with XRE-family HTH domain
VYFNALQRKLIEIARERVHAGGLTERGLARLCGVSQSHMHNVLKEIRWLSNASADRLMAALDMEIPDLISRISPRNNTDISLVPAMRGRIGPGADGDLESTRGYVPLPSFVVKGVADAVAGWLGSDLVLPRELAARDLVLLDQNPLARAAPAAGLLWVVSEGAGLRVRYVAVEKDRLRIGNALTREDPARWQSTPLQGRNILNIVRARIVWMGREIEKAPAGPAVAAGKGD